MKKLLQGLNNNQLKLIAMLSMLLDHMGRELFPQADILPIIGRLAFPVFSYMIAEGCTYTKNRRKYFLSVFIVGAACQAVYFIAERSLYQNVLITFSLSIAIIFLTDNFIRRKSVKTFVPALAICLLTVFLCLILPRFAWAKGFHIDYSLAGVLVPVMVYFAPEKKTKALCFSLMLVVLSLTMGSIQWFSLMSIPLVLLYNGKRGKRNMKLLFYIFYPAHLAVIYLISLIPGI